MRARTRLTLCLAALLVAGCGGGGSGSDPIAPPASCDVADRKVWLRDYMRAWYLWAALGPSPDPVPFGSIDDYFPALLYGGGGTVPADRFSRLESTESYRRFYDEGRTLGYGLSVAGLEVEGRPDLPLRVRHVEPQSDAAAQGLQRGQQIVSLGGRPASELIADNDYEALVPDSEGEQLALVVRDGAGERAVTLTAAVYPLTPVPAEALLTSPGGRRVGYLMVKDMIGQIDAPVTAAIARFAASGVDELVLDLRYNGGGRVSVGRTLASVVDPARTAGEVYARLRYNDQRAGDYDQTYRFEERPGLGLNRVFVLAGARTCSASEQLIHGLAPFVEVVLVGDATCGKPVGFLPRDDGCGTTVSAVNFDSVNARDEGSYYDGFAPHCATADDLDHPLGDPAEGLLATALALADGGACPPQAAARAQPLAASARAAIRRGAGEPMPARGMVAD
ncbi:MAG: peptidase S41 [Burkholderiaceae bacterium]|nr:peptidase S41 [Burkholderiaceae bacterium]MCP5288490.1 peptidase S41 [Burkholderiaceae bacterium]